MSNLQTGKKKSAGFFLFFIFFGILYVKDKKEEDAGESLEHP